MELTITYWIGSFILFATSNLGVCDSPHKKTLDLNIENCFRSISTKLVKMQVPHHPSESLHSYYHCKTSVMNGPRVLHYASILPADSPG